MKINKLVLRRSWLGITTLGLLMFVALAIRPQQGVRADGTFSLDGVIENQYGSTRSIDGRGNDASDGDSAACDSDANRGNLMDFNAYSDDVDNDTTTTADNEWWFAWTIDSSHALDVTGAGNFFGIDQTNQVNYLIGIDVGCNGGALGDMNAGTPYQRLFSWKNNTNGLGVDYFLALNPTGANTLNAGLYDATKTNIVPHGDIPVTTRVVDLRRQIEVQLKDDVGSDTLPADLKNNDQLCLLLVSTQNTNGGFVYDAVGNGGDAYSCNTGYRQIGNTNTLPDYVNTQQNCLLDSRPRMGVPGTRYCTSNATRQLLNTINTDTCLGNGVVIDGDADAGKYTLLSETGYAGPYSGGDSMHSDFFGESSAFQTDSAAGGGVTYYGTNGNADVGDVYAYMDKNYMYFLTSGRLSAFGGTGAAAGNDTDNANLFIAIDFASIDSNTDTGDKGSAAAGSENYTPQDAAHGADAGLHPGSRRINFRGWDPDYILEMVWAGNDNSTGAFQLWRYNAGAWSVVSAPADYLNKEGWNTFTTAMLSGADAYMGRTAAASASTRQSISSYEFAIPWDDFVGLVNNGAGQEIKLGVYTTKNENDYDVNDQAPGIGQGCLGLGCQERIGDDFDDDDDINSGRDQLPFVGQNYNDGGDQPASDNASTDTDTIEEFFVFKSNATSCAALGNYVWLDENSDGYQDDGEAGIPNITMTVNYDANGDNDYADTIRAAQDFNGDGDTSDNGEAAITEASYLTSLTDSSGLYLLPRLIPGRYQVNVGTVPTGLTQTTITGSTPDGGDFLNQSTGYVLNLSNMEEDLSADFGYNWNPTADVTGNTNTAALGDRVWYDQDADGVQDPNEVGIAGVTVELWRVDNSGDGYVGTTDDGTGTPLATATTDANGNYLFDGLAPGAYVVKVSGTPLTGLTQTGDPDYFGRVPTTNDMKTTVPVILSPGDVFLNVDFGYDTANLGSIGDTIWFDTNASGTDTDEAMEANEYGIAGVTVSLIKDLDGDGVWDAGEPIIATDITDASGMYLFPGLPVTDGVGSDDYIVWVNDANSVLMGLRPTYDNDGANNTAPISSITSGYGISAVQDLTTTAVTSQDFSYTNANQYVVPVPGNDVVATGFGSTGRHNPFSDPDPVANNTGLDGAVGDTVWLDLDSDGMQDAGEPGIEGVTVTLGVDLNNDGDFADTGESVLATTVTDENGKYLFGGLPVNAIYDVVVTPPAGLTQTYDQDTPLNHHSEVILGTYDANKDGDTGDAGEASNPTVDLNQDFGYIGLNTISSLVWKDVDADGIHDTNEVGINGVTLEVYRDLNGNGKVDAGEPRYGRTTTMNAPAAAPAGYTSGAYSQAAEAPTPGNAGFYYFGGLPDGKYVVVVTDDDGLLNGYWHSYGDQAVATDNTSKNDPYAVDLDSAMASGTGVAVESVDFGYYVDPAAVGSYVWYDQDGDGVQDEGTGYGIPNAEVVLATSGITGMPNIKALTDSAGRYFIGNLLLDESFNGHQSSNTGSSSNAGATEPIHTLSVDYTGAGANSVKTLLGATVVSTIIDSGTVNTNQLGEAAASDHDNDADNPNGIVTYPVKGAYDSNNDHGSVDRGDDSSAISGATLAGLDLGNYTGYDNDNDFGFVILDYGDAPNNAANQTSGGSTSTPGGFTTVPSHAILFPTQGVVTVPTAVYLGSAKPDAELDGQAGVTATGDGADEDGFVLGTDTFAGLASWPTAGTNQVNVRATGSGTVYAWIDWGSGFATTATSTAFSNLTNGTVTLQFPDTGLPASGSFPATAYMRLVVVPTGAAAPTQTGLAGAGEVEDHVLRFTPTAVELVSADAVSPSNLVTFVALAVAGLALASTAAVWVIRRRRNVA